ncbi:MAG: ribonuclease HII [Thermoplasmata archaeon]
MQCGLDEAGRGPVIGPMVIAMVCGDADQLAAIGVRDSKILSPARREALYADIKRIAESVTFSVVSVAEINAEMIHQTMNEIEHSRYLALIRKAKYPVFVDAFDVDVSRLENRLSMESGHEIHAMHRADSTFAIVSAASIVAKVERDSFIEELHKEYGDFGSGYPSDPRTVAFLKKCISNKIDVSKIVRKEWATWKKLVGVGSQKDLRSDYTSVI